MLQFAAGMVYLALSGAGLYVGYLHALGDPGSVSGLIGLAVMTVGPQLGLAFAIWALQDGRVET